jgi:hypothetical protein
MPRKNSERFDFGFPVRYNEAAKTAFHAKARAALESLARHLHWPDSSYDLRSNRAGPAVSGEIILHGGRLYVQVSQSCMGPRFGVLFRSCQGSHDYTGGVNNFAPLELLNTPATLARLIKRAGLGGHGRG